MTFIKCIVRLAANREYGRPRYDLVVKVGDDEFCIVDTTGDENYAIKTGERFILAMARGGIPVDGSGLYGADVL